MSEVWTIGGARAWLVDRLKERGVDTPQLDADLMLGAAVGLDRVGVIAAIDRPLSSDERERLRTYARRRLDGEPVAYVLGRKEFWEFELAVGPGVLVPRPETEFLLDAVAELHRAGAIPAGGVADLGSGSGAIALGLAALLGRPVLALEASSAAAAYARRNFAAYPQYAIELIEADWLALPAGYTLALAASNPPYVADATWDTLAPEVRAEPKEAHVAGPEGTEAIQALAAGLPAHMVPGGVWLCEVGAGQRPAVEAILAATGWERPRWWRDYSGHERVFAAARML